MQSSTLLMVLFGLVAVGHSSYIRLNGDCPGNDINIAPGATTNALCEKACDSNPSCKGFSFDYGWMGPRCILKSQSCGLAEGRCAHGTWCFYKKPAGAYTSLVTDCPGNDLNTIHATTTIAACESACTASSTCNGFSFDYGWMGPRCILKSQSCSIAEGRCASGNWCFHKKPADAYIALSGDCAGNDMNTISPGTVQGCENACNANTACKGFSFDNGHLGPRCILKSKSCGLSQSRCQGAWCFYKKPSASYGALTGDCPGNDMSWPSATTIAGCKVACNGNAACKGFSFDYGWAGPRCILKSQACSLGEGRCNTGTWCFWKKL